jgi:hypothetical protein
MEKILDFRLQIVDWGQEKKTAVVGPRCCRREHSAERIAKKQWGIKHGER